jgi:hypothetical protein
MGDIGSHKLTCFASVAANGMAYAKRNVREGLLGRMLMELLETRIMVKQVGNRYTYVLWNDWLSL